MPVGQGCPHGAEGAGVLATMRRPPSSLHGMMLRSRRRFGRILEVLEKFQVPHASVLGNHDHEADLSRWGSGGRGAGVMSGTGRRRQSGQGGGPMSAAALHM
jgi:hypothetical protein